MKFKPASIRDATEAFQLVDDALRATSLNLSIRVLGGISMLLLGVRDRVTIDIDVAATADAHEFQKTCATLGIPVDIVTIASTVDLARCPTVTVFRGANLTVESVTPRDLLKLKLERFYKQDPEDIHAIIRRMPISYDEFEAIVADMLPDFIGNVRSLILSAQIVVEQLWPDRVDPFRHTMEKRR